MNNKLKAFLIGATGMGLVILLALGTSSIVRADNTIKNALIERGIDHIYISNREDGIADRIIIFSLDDFAEVCSINGVTTVTIDNGMLDGAELTCEPV